MFVTSGWILTKGSLLVLDLSLDDHILSLWMFLQQHKWRLHIPKDITNETTVADVDSQTRTVGCVAVDNEENLASATCTGGMVNKMEGKIGDTPVIGAGTFASSHGAASATGKGEEIIHDTVARDVAAVMEFKDLSLKEAAAYVIAECISRRNVEWFAVSAKGEVTMTCNTTDILQACATKDGYSEIGKWKSEQHYSDLERIDMSETTYVALQDSTLENAPYICFIFINWSFVYQLAFIFVFYSSLEDKAVVKGGVMLGTSG